MKKKILITLSVLILLSTISMMALAANPLKLVVNSKEIQSDVAPQLINDRTMVPLRWVAEALGANVEWDGQAVYITGSLAHSTGSISKEEVTLLVKNQGKDKEDSYYIEGLSYEMANIDLDADLEIIAKIDGAVHLGQIFVFDKDSAGEYQLITEQNWKVENWDLDNPIEIDGKRIFKLITRDGGTGVDSFTVHLWYLEKGNFIHAWQGILLERSVALTPESYYKRVGGYQVDIEGKRLYTWETTHQLEEDGVTPKGEVKTTTDMYLFDGSVFRR